MSQTKGYKASLSGKIYENPYKRTQSLKDSWNLGQKEQQNQPEELIMRKYQSAQQNAEWTIKVSLSEQFNDIQQTSSLPENDIDIKDRDDQLAEKQPENKQTTE